jgi:hypothetical protein
MKKSRKYHYDEENGIFVLEDDISVNWLLSQIFDLPKLQITKISNDDLQKFIDILSKSDLRMPNGQHSIFWLRDQIVEKLQMSNVKIGEAWYKVSIRYRFIIEIIDQVLIEIENIKEKMEIKVEEKQEIQLDFNNIKAYFEPI